MTVAAWATAIAACVGAAASTYSAVENASKGGPKAPAPNFGEQGKKIETPNPFNGAGGGSMLGGKPVASLAASLESGASQAPQNQFGPNVNPNFLEDDERKQWLMNLLGNK
jgi:hypothetical protein